MRLPNGLLVISILCLILGLLGACAGPLGCVSTIFSEQMSAMGQQPGMSSAVVDAQAELLRRAGWLQIPALLSAVLTTLLAITLIAGGAGTLTARGWGPALLRLAVVGGLVLEPLKFALQVTNTAVSWGPSQEIVGAMAADVPGGAPPGMEGILSGTMAFALLLSVLVPLLWTAAKVALFVVGLRVLRSEPTREFLDALDAE